MNSDASPRAFFLPPARWTMPAIFAGLLVAGCAQKPQNPMAAAPAAVPVKVATVAEKTIPVQVRAIGNVEAYSTVSIKAQVSGELTSVAFREGDEVRKSQLLFTIDRRPFEAALLQAQANLARDTARAQNARIQADRAEKLSREGVISSQQRDEAVTEADALDAAVKADQAALVQAKLDLEYCTITSPIDGRTGSLRVHPGNLVKANDVPILVVILQVNPIYVNFTVPEQYLADVKRYKAAGTLKVEAEIPASPEGVSGPGAANSGGADAGAAANEQGTLSFIDNAVDNTTGTIHLKAAFANRLRRLWPGQFVNVVLTLTAQPNAIVVPAPAVQTGQAGTYVYVVKPDQTAESRPVAVGRTVGGDTVIAKGLQPGEVVVTDGQLRLFPGAKVQVKGRS